VTTLVDPTVLWWVKCLFLFVLFPRFAFCACGLYFLLPRLMGVMNLLTVRDVYRPPPGRITPSFVNFNPTVCVFPPFWTRLGLFSFDPRLASPCDRCLFGLFLVEWMVGM
jgi:hypothetical protein